MDMMDMAVAWKKVKVLGKGSYGLVYLAIHDDPSYTKPIAVKSSLMERAYSLQREEIILRSLVGCKQVIQYISKKITIEDGHVIHNLLLEYAPYGSLRDLIKKGPLLEIEVRVYTYMILRGLSHIHQLQLIHGDLKPDNILLFPSSLYCARFQLKLADFGLSRIRGEKLQGDYDEFGRKKVMFRGTPFYMSPESVVGQVDTPLDIWSLGCIVFEMSTGFSPWKNYRGLTNDELIIKLGLQGEAPVIPHDLMSLKCRDFLSKCFEKDPQKRWTAEMLLNHPFLFR